jgi:hypothetical protein
LNINSIPFFIKKKDFAEENLKAKSMSEYEDEIGSG